MTEQRIVSAKVTQEELALIETEMDDQDINTSEVLRRALWHYFLRRNKSRRKESGR